MTLKFPSRPRALLGLLLTAVLLGCGIGEEDLAKWKGIRGGTERLSGFLASPQRPLELRVRAARYLFETDAAGQIVYVLQQAPAEDRDLVLEPFFIWLGPRFLDEDPAVGARAKDVLYQLVPLAKELSPESIDGTIERFMDWGLEAMFAPKAPAGRPVEQVITAVGLTWPRRAIPPLIKLMKGAREPAQVVRLSKLGDSFADVPGRVALAGALLDIARKTLPALPEELVVAMAGNGNETLMRFLLDAARDPEVPLPVRVACIEKAVPRLGERAVEGLGALMTSEDPLTHNSLRLAALDQLWELRGPKGLVATLEALPDGRGWPEDGREMAETIDRFCDDALKPKAAKARKPLLEALESENLTARIFAAECVHRLFPDEAVELLSPLKDDKTPLRGFGGSDEKPPVLGDLARGKMPE